MNGVTGPRRAAGVDAGDLAARLVPELARQGLTLATCESLTGGLLGATLTAMPGASVAYLGGFITYATRLKNELAGVDAGHLEREGAVNAETAEQMARGTLQKTGADFALACSGVAGPDPQDGAAPGTVFVALAQRQEGSPQVWSQRLELDGSRSQIRALTISAALEWLLTHVDVDGEQGRPSAR